MADDYANQIDVDLPTHQGTTENISYAEPENGTNDVHSASNSCGWSDFFIHSDVYKAINDCGFEHPSEVQYKAIPITRMGTDALIQAKSGMGKTAVYAISILHQNPNPSDKVESLIIVHTHELAVQVSDEFRRFAKYLPDVRIAAFYGGGAKEDENIATLMKERPNVVVGTPGRLRALINRKVLDLDAVRFFVVDECDILLEKYRRDIQDIFMATPKTKQVMMLSATIDESIRKLCCSFMREPKEIIINEFRVLSLDYVVQYFDEVDYNSKTRRLTELLDDIEFNQVIIFVNASVNAKKLCRVLCANNFPAIVACTSMPQSDRTKAYNDFKEAKARILVSTDLMGRGVDFANVNVVINYDLPTEVDSYLHRVGRAGRFGTKGIGISLVASKEDGEQLNKIQERFSAKIQKYDGKIDPAVYKI